MTSPRLSTVGTISAIEKALDDYWALADLYHNNQRMFLKHAEAIRAARAELAELLHDCMALSAGACIVDGGLVGDDGGSPFCTMRERAEKAEAELAELRAQPVEAAYREGWKRGWLNGHTSTINEDIVDLCWDRSQARANQPEASLQNLQISTGQPEPGREVERRTYWAIEYAGKYMIPGGGWSVLEHANLFHKIQYADAVGSLEGGRPVEVEVIVRELEPRR